MNDAYDRLEKLASEFKKDTGLLAPFKGAPNAVGGDPEYDHNYRVRQWSKWMQNRKGVEK